MVRFNSIAAVVVAFSVAFPMVAACGEELIETPDADVPAVVNNTMFDLGVDVTNVPATPGAVKTFLGSLGADSVQILMKTCEHYMEAPVTAQSQDTLTFCAIAVDTEA